MSSKRKFIYPTDQEEAAIRRGIVDDPDTRELSDDEFTRLRPFGEVMAKRRAGRPPLQSPKEQVSIRYDADILEAFRATGDGWQTRMNAALRVYLSEHPLGKANR
jgi:uncharacterized protein (DUF4415 family)